MKRLSVGASASSRYWAARSQLSSVGSTPRVPTDWEKFWGRVLRLVSAAAASAYPALPEYFAMRSVMDWTLVMFSRPKATYWWVAIATDCDASAPDGPITSSEMF